MDHDPHAHEPHQAHEPPEPDVFDLTPPADIDPDPVVSVPVVDLDEGGTAVGGARGPGVDDAGPDPDPPGGGPGTVPGAVDDGSVPAPDPVDLGTGERPEANPIVLDDPPAGPVGDAAGAPEPISLDLGDAPSADGPDGDAGADDQAIHLDGDLDEPTSRDHPGTASDSDGSDDEKPTDAVELTVDAVPPAGELQLAEDNGLLRPALVAAALAAIGAGAAAGRLLGGRWSSASNPPDLTAALDQLGLDARVEHADLRELRDRMADGHRVLLSTDGTAGVDVDAVVEVVRIDESAGVVEVVGRSGARGSHHLDELLAAWDESANQLVVATGTEGTVVLLPVVLGPSHTVPARQGRA
jgi:hypothetical protein